MQQQTAIIYVRVSTEDQVAEGISVEAQQTKLAAWCVANDYKLLAVHTDAGLSGARADNRPALQAALKQACESKSALVVYSLSRLARSTKDTIAIGERLDRAGADLVSLSEKIDTTTAAGKMVFRMLAVMAEFERDQVAERTRFAMSHKKRKGERVGTIPFGFDLASDGCTLVENASELEAVDAMRELRALGFSYRKIATEIGRRGFVTKQHLATWSHTSIQSILSRARNS